MRDFCQPPPEKIPENAAAPEISRHFPESGLKESRFSMILIGYRENNAIRE